MAILPQRPWIDYPLPEQLLRSLEKQVAMYVNTPKEALPTAIRSEVRLQLTRYGLLTSGADVGAFVTSIQKSPITIAVGDVSGVFTPRMVTADVCGRDYRVEYAIVGDLLLRSRKETTVSEQVQDVEFRPGCPSVAHVEAALRLGLEWRCGISDYIDFRYRMVVNDGAVCLDCNPFRPDAKMQQYAAFVGSSASHRTWRPCRPDGVAVSWSALDDEVAKAAAMPTAPMTTTPSPTPTPQRFSVGDVVMCSLFKDGDGGVRYPDDKLEKLQRNLGVGVVEGCWQDHRRYRVRSIATDEVHTWPASALAAAENWGLKVGDEVVTPRFESQRGLVYYSDMGEYVGKMGCVADAQTQLGACMVRVHGWYWPAEDVARATAKAKLAAPKQGEAKAMPTTTQQQQLGRVPTAEEIDAHDKAHGGRWKTNYADGALRMWLRAGLAVGWYSPDYSQDSSAWQVALRLDWLSHHNLQPIDAAGNVVPWPVVASKPHQAGGTSTPTIVSPVEFRQLTRGIIEANPRQIWQHEGERKDLFHKYLYVDDVLRADVMSQYVQWSSSPTLLGCAHDEAYRSKARPICAATMLPMSWDELKPSLDVAKPSPLPRDGDAMTVESAVAVAEEGARRAFKSMLADQGATDITIQSLPGGLSATYNITPKPFAQEITLPLHIAQETTMPTNNPTTGQPDTTKPDTTTTKPSRARRAISAAKTRAPIELGLNRLHKVIARKALKMFKGTRQERQVVQRFLGDLLASEYGKAFTGAALATVVPYGASLPGLAKHADKLDAVADELAARSATILAVELGGAVIDAVEPLIDIVVDMASGSQGKDGVEVLDATVRGGSTPALPSNVSPELGDILSVGARCRTTA